MEQATETIPEPYRPISGTEYSWYKAAQSGTGITVLALHLTKPIPFLNLQNALTLLQNYHPVLASSFSATHLLPHPIPTSLASLPLPPRVSSLSDVLEHELNLNPWKSEREDELESNFYATVYAEEYVALRIHTGVCDRTSAVEILKEVMVMAGEGRVEVEEKGEVRMGIEEGIRKEDSWKWFFAKGKDLVGYSVNGLRSYGLGFETVGVERRSEVVRLRLGEAETFQLLNACKEKGVKLCGAIAAAGLIATYSSKHLENNQAETYSLVTLIDCRKFLDPVLTERDVGFYHSAIMNTHTIHSEDGLWDVALRIHNAYDNAKKNKKHLTDIGDLNYLMCKAIDNPHLTPSSSMRTAVISVFEEPGVYEPSELHSKLGVQDYVGCASVHGVGPSVAIFDTIRDGRLDCACVYPSPLHSRKQITELVEHMVKILSEGSHDS